MSKIIYLTDKYSINKMNNFWNSNMKSQNTKEDLNQWIGGEYYIQVSLYNQIKNNNNFKIIYTCEKYDDNILIQSKFIIVPGWREISNNFIKFKNKIYSYIYFDSDDTKTIMKDHFFTPYKYYNLNIFLPVTPIELPSNEVSTINFSEFKINGLLIGKCISHVIHKRKQNELIHLLDILKFKVFSVIRPLYNFTQTINYLQKDIVNHKEFSNKICNHKNLYNLGILNPIDFRFLLKHCKYCFFYHTADYQPTIMEALYSNCIILASQNVIPNDLLNNKNIFLLDNLSDNEILELIDNIENDKIVFDINEIPKDYTNENKINVLTNLIV